MSFKVSQERTVLVKILCSNLPNFNLDSFIELFLDKCPLEYLRDYIFGIASHNHFNKIFSINFISQTPPEIIDNFLHKYQQPQPITTIDGIQLLIQTNTPPKPMQMITLYPMPFNISTDLLTKITSNWGQLERFNFGRHKRLPMIRNPYLHIILKNPKRANIPDTIKINNKFVTVTVQGEESIPRCIYCKSRNHTIDNCTLCPKQTYSNPLQNTSEETQNTQNESPEKKQSTQTPKNEGISYASVVQNRNTPQPSTCMEQDAEKRSPPCNQLKTSQENQEKEEKPPNTTLSKSIDEPSSVDTSKTSESSTKFQTKQYPIIPYQNNDLRLSSSGSSSEYSESEPDTHLTTSHKRQVEASSSDAKPYKKKKPKRPKLLSS